MTNVTGDEYDELEARVSALEAQVVSLRARNADVRGEFARVHEEIAQLRAGVEDVRDQQRDHAAALLAQSARLDRCFELLQAHSASLAMLADSSNEHGASLARNTATLDQHTATLDQHGEMLSEILRRLDAA